MKRKRLPTLINLLLILVLNGCQATEGATGLLQGNILLWHSWDEHDALVLDQVLERVSEIDPQIHVISVHLPADELLNRYIVATQQGFGPDLLIGPNEWVGELAEAGVVRPVDPTDVGRHSYLPTTLVAVWYQQSHYGFPLSAAPAALYYNRTLTSTIPQTFEVLLDEAHTGKSVAFVPRFQPAYWGIQPFGSGLFDESGRFTLAESGFSEWLTWISEVSHLPGVILNADALALRQLFVEGRAAYYVAGPEELALLVDVMGEDAVGVAPLPTGPLGPSGPLLPVEAVMVGTASSAEQTAAALNVAGFLTNPQQSTAFMREIGLIPANRQVFVDPRIYPNLAGFADQALTADVLPNELDTEAVYLLGDRAYANVLAGTLTPDEAVCEFGLAVIVLQGYDAEQVDLPADCVAPDDD